mgnify:CR=1 FL=1
MHREKLSCIKKNCCAPCRIVLYHEKLLCTVKNCFASRNIVVHRVKLFCITKYCCAPCKIVLYHEKSLCIQLNIELCFALVGHRSKLHKLDNHKSHAVLNCKIINSKSYYNLLSFGCWQNHSFKLVKNSLLTLEITSSSNFTKMCVGDEQHQNNGTLQMPAVVNNR